LLLVQVEAQETAVKFVREVQVVVQQVLMVPLTAAVVDLVERNLLLVQAEMVVVEQVVQAADVMAAQAPVLHKILRREDWGSVMVVVVLLIQVTQVVAEVEADISVVVVVVAIKLVWPEAGVVVTSVVQVLQLARLLLEVALLQVIVLMLLEAQVETVGLQARAVTVVDLLSR
jgi:hypothetical protein